jgi:hypothetical protein
MQRPPSRFAQGWSLSIQSGANRLTEVFQQVPTIRRLKRLGGAAPGGVGIGGAAIRADHLDLRVLLPPLGNRIGFPVRRTSLSRVSPLAGMARRSRQTCAGLTAQSQSKVALDLAQAPGATRPGSGGDGGQAFGEDPPGALGGGAAKAARLDPDQHGTPLPGQIGQGPGGTGCGPGARRGHRPGSRIPKPSERS